MSATQYKVDIRDHHFVLFEQLRVQDIDDPRYAEYGEELYAMILEQAQKFAEETIAPLNQSGDRVGCTWDDGDVRTPPGYKEAYDLFRGAGWGGMSTPVEDGGQGLPLPVALAVIEMFTGGCPAFVMYPGLTASAANLIADMGSDDAAGVIVPELVPDPAPEMDGGMAGEAAIPEPTGALLYMLGALLTTRAVRRKR